MQPSFSQQKLNCENRAIFIFVFYFHAKLLSGWGLEPSGWEFLRPKKYGNNEEFEKDLNLAVAKETEINRYVF